MQYPPLMRKYILRNFNPLLLPLKINSIFTCTYTKLDYTISVPVIFLLQKRTFLKTDDNQNRVENENENGNEFQSINQDSILKIPISKQNFDQANTVTITEENKSRLKSTTTTSATLASSVLGSRQTKSNRSKRKSVRINLGKIYISSGKELKRESIDSDQIEYNSNEDSILTTHNKEIIETEIDLPTDEAISTSFPNDENEIEIEYGKNNLSDESIEESNEENIKTKTKKKTKSSIKKKTKKPKEKKDVEPYSALLSEVIENMKKYNHCVLLTKVGDFYELYFEHAQKYGPKLQLRVAEKKIRDGKTVYMAGFPHKQLSRYLKILVGDMQKHVAIAEEFASAIGNNKYVRKVNQVMSPGTIINESIVDPFSNNHLMTLIPVHDRDDVNNNSNTNNHKVALAWLDLSTGKFYVQNTTLAFIESYINRIQPSEILYLDLKFNNNSINTYIFDLINNYKNTKYFTLTSIKDKWNLSKILEKKRNLKVLTNLLVDTWKNNCIEQINDEEEFSKCFNKFNASELSSILILIDYISQCFPENKIDINLPVKKIESQYLILDSNSISNLELNFVRKSSSNLSTNGSVFSAINRTSTVQGSRLLREWLLAPSTNKEIIKNRLDLTESLANDGASLRENICNLLSKLDDVERIIQFLSLNQKVSIRHLLKIANSILISNDLLNLLRTNGFAKKQKSFINLVSSCSIEKANEIALRIKSVIDEDISEDLRDEEINNVDLDDDSETVSDNINLETVSDTSTSDSLFVKLAEKDFKSWLKPNASERLLALISKRSKYFQQINELELKMRVTAETDNIGFKWSYSLGGYVFLKIKSRESRDDLIFNKLKDLLGECHIIKGSKTTSYIYSPIWQQLSLHLFNVHLEIISEENKIKEQLKSSLLKIRDEILKVQETMIHLDIACSFARMTDEHNLVRPNFDSNNKNNLSIIGGRHLPVEYSLSRDGIKFTGNNLIIGGEINGEKIDDVWLITGPNMAGKSTFLRQNALICILGQIGCFVPAKKADLCIIDRIFSRIGANDSLIENMSTFMMEMKESATILNYATSSSFVIMDEIGRGTSTKEGIAIAYACLYYIHNINKCKTLFATHFHELVDMVNDLPRIGLYCTTVHENEDGSFFYRHKIKKGIERSSHALKVAQMAGLPIEVIDIAKKIIQEET